VKDFSPHAILRSPLTSDEEVERMIQASLASSNGEPLVLLLIDPLEPTPKDEPSSQGSLPGFEKPT
jgi:hypothetical protein